MATNYTTTASPQLPSLPTYNLEPLPPLLPFISDAYLSVILPIAAYWIVSLLFHIIDELDLFPQYRLHTPAEVSSRNKASRWDVFRDVIIQQVLQAAFGMGLAFIEDQAIMGKDNYNIANWALKIRLAQRAVPWALSAVGVNALQLAKNNLVSHPALAGILAGGSDQIVMKLGLAATSSIGAATFAGWELTLAKAVYWYIVPVIQFAVAICILDTWQYFWHRAMHLNKWLYTTFHSRHHRLYVPYAYGALYNHPVEGFLLDTLGAGLGYLLTGMTTRQSMWFFTCSTIKTVDDHCGYALPFDPLQHLTANNAAYHDIHHQSWGIKTNFSQPFFTIWDGWLKTKWTGDVTLRYERDRKVAERKIAKEQAESPIDAAIQDVPNSSSTELSSYQAEQLKKAAMIEAGATTPRRSTRNKRASSNVGNLKGLKERMEGSFSLCQPRVESTH